MQQACIEDACMQPACRIEDIIQSWRRLRGERAVPCVRDDALSATMMLAPDRDNVFRVMVAGALAQRWSGLAFGAAFVSILAQEHRRQMTRRLADAARRQTPSLTRAHRSLTRAHRSLTRARNCAGSNVEIDILLLPLRSARSGRAGPAGDAMVLVGLSPVAMQPLCQNLTDCRDMVLDCSGPLPGFVAPVIQP